MFYLKLKFKNNHGQYHEILIPFSGTKLHEVLRDPGAEIRQLYHFLYPALDKEKVFKHLFIILCGSLSKAPLAEPED